MKFQSQKLDSVYVGLIFGIIAPVIAMEVYHQFKFDYMTISRFINFLIMGRTHSHVISLGVIINLAVFGFFNWRELFLSAKGVLIATFIYAGLIVFLKFFT